MTFYSRTGYCVLLAALLIGGSSPAQEARPEPAAVDDILRMRSFTFTAPIELSPDGRWVTYSLIDPRNRSKVRSDQGVITKTGTTRIAMGSDVWVANTATGHARNFTGGKGSSWSASWSPDGRHLAFFSDQGGAVHLWVWEVGSDRIRRISDVIIRTFAAYEVPRWTADGRHVVAKVLPEKMTLAQLMGWPESKTVITNSPLIDGAVTATVYRSAASADTSPGRIGQPHDGTLARWTRADLAAIDVATGKARRLVRDLPIANYWLAPDGRQIAYTSLRQDAPPGRNLYDLNVITINGDSSQVVAHRIPSDYGSSVSWAPNGKLLAYFTSPTRSSALEMSSHGRCFVASVDGGALRDVTPGRAATFGSHFAVPVWDAESEHLYLAARDTLWKVPVSGGEPTVAGTVQERQLVGIVGRAQGGKVWSPDDGQSVYVRTRNHKTKSEGIARVDIVAGRAELLFEEAKAITGQYSEFGMDALASRVAYILEDGQQPPDIWIADNGFKERRRLTHINPQLDRYTFGATRLIEWYSADGELLQGALLLPSGYVPGGRYPLIVHVYGGVSESRTLTRFGGSSWEVKNMQLLATRGYAVLFPDAPQRVGTPMLDLAKAVLPGINKVVELGIADPDRIGVMGHSYGGYSTLALIVQSQRFKAAVSLQGLSDLISMYGHMTPTGAGHTSYTEGGQGAIGGTLWQARHRYIENSPLFYLDRVGTPLLVVHGSEDLSLPSGFAAQTYTGLRRLGKEVEYVSYAGEGHVDWSYANARDYVMRMIRWFDHHMHKPDGTRP
jgi:dipeptidyl aminopeptidase/acylaminoacyl peptidase